MRMTRSRSAHLLEPTFRGINLEDIQAPECFYLEETLKTNMNIPVFYDNQHGTAIITGAALLNALELVDKPIDKVRMVFYGSGPSGIATAEHYVRLSVRRENIVMVETKGVIYEGRVDGLMRAAFLPGSSRPEDATVSQLDTVQR